jgi:hypothetical protein
VTANTWSYWTALSSRSPSPLIITGQHDVQPVGSAPSLNCTEAWLGLLVQNSEAVTFYLVEPYKWSLIANNYKMQYKNVYV